MALVTGARVKIGYQAALKLLRAGAHVVALTRFPVDAAARYAQEADYGSFRERLQIHGLDLRHTPSVELFARWLGEQLPRLDYILNNACQTVRRPAGFLPAPAGARGAGRRWRCRWISAHRSRVTMRCAARCWTRRRAAYRQARNS